MYSAPADCRLRLVARHRLRLLSRGLRPAAADGQSCPALCTIDARNHASAHHQPEAKRSQFAASPPPFFQRLVAALHVCSVGGAMQYSVSDAPPADGAAPTAAHPIGCIFATLFASTDRPCVVTVSATLTEPQLAAAAWTEAAACAARSRTAAVWPRPAWASPAPAPASAPFSAQARLSTVFVRSVACWFISFSGCLLACSIDRAIGNVLFVCLLVCFSCQAPLCV